MSKKRSPRLQKKLKYELLGLLFVFLAIFGSGASMISDGFFSGSLEYIFRFFLGIWYFVASVFLLITGVFLLFKRRLPNFLHKKMIGFYIIFLGLILFTHIQTYEQLLFDPSRGSILRETWNQFTFYLKERTNAFQTGGGMIGGILFTFCHFLFSTIGAKIVAVFSMLIGLIFMTNLTLGELFSKIKSKLKSIKDKIGLQIQMYKESKTMHDNSDLSIPEEKTNFEEEIAHEPPNIHDFSEVSYTFVEETLAKSEAEETETVEIKDQDDDHENMHYDLPSPELLRTPKTTQTKQQEKSHIQSTVKTLEQTFDSFGVRARVTNVHVGPSVTKYEVYPEAGVKVSRIVSLHDDLALALAAKDIRIEAPIPGKSAVGIEVPNKDTAIVSLREVLDFTKSQTNKLLFALGRDISGEAIVGDLSKMPHLLIAGATGSGKSVCINSIIVTILMRAKPDEVKMMMIDPKKVELNVYNGIPHLIAPVVTDPKQASRALKKVVAEMERRYELFSETGTRNIESYNELLRQQKHTVDETHEPLPYIVVLVDELADLMMVASKDVEEAITRLAQMARAAGIHLIIATQRPSVDVITGVIKANIPSRIAFSVSSQTDSRTILDTGGAEKLLGRGDMLYMPIGLSKPLRVQGAYLSDDEVERIVEHCMNQQPVHYQEEMIPEKEDEIDEEVDDELYEEAVNLVTEMQSASVSMLQRRFRIGYNRAARLIDAMEDRGIVGPYEGTRPRAVLVSKQNHEKSS